MCMSKVMKQKDKVEKDEEWKIEMVTGKTINIIISMTLSY